MMECPLCLYAYYHWGPTRHWTYELLKNLSWNKMMTLEMKVSVYQRDPWITFYCSSYCTVLCHISNGCSTIIDQSHECFSLLPLDTTYLWTTYYNTSRWLFVLMANEQVRTSSQVPKSNGFLPSNLSPTTHCPLRIGSGHTSVLAWPKQSTNSAVN